LRLALKDILQSRLLSVDLHSNRGLASRLSR
jgi:hypothetical protein